MPVINGYSSALNGINKGLYQLERHASDIASADAMNGNESPPLTESLIGLRQSELQVQASMEVVRTLDSVLGSLLDVKA